MLDEMRDADESTTPPASLLERLRADPVRAPEHLALAAADSIRAAGRHVGRIGSAM